MNVKDEWNIPGQMSIYDLDIWCGKTYPEHSAVTTERTSVPCLKKRQKSQTKMPLFLDLRKNGGAQGVSWETDGQSLGEYMMHSFGEYPNEEKESRLSQILEATPHPKYSLSARACQGILNRAERRGKKLPEQLEMALRRQSVFKNEQDAMGGAREYLSNMNGQEHCQPSIINPCSERVSNVGDPQFSITAAHENAVCVSLNSKQMCLETGNNVASTLGANDYKEPQAVLQGRERTVVCSVDYSADANVDKTNALLAGNNDNHNVPAVCYGLDRASFNQGKNAQYNFSVDEELAQTLVAKGAGGGYDNTVGALCARDYKGVGNQYVTEGKVIVTRIE